MANGVPSIRSPVDCGGLGKHESSGLARFRWVHWHRWLATGLWKKQLLQYLQRKPVRLEASTHKSAHAGIFCDSWLDLWPFDPKTNGFPGLIMETFLCQVWQSLLHRCLRYRAEKQTHRQTEVKTLPPRRLSAWVTRTEVCICVSVWLKMIVACCPTGSAFWAHADDMRRMAGSGGRSFTGHQDWAFQGWNSSEGWRHISERFRGSNSVVWWSASSHLHRQDKTCTQSASGNFAQITHATNHHVACPMTRVDRGLSLSPLSLHFPPFTASFTVLFPFLTSFICFLAFPSLPSLPE